MAGAPVRVDIKVDSARASEAFKEAKRDINMRAKQGLRRAAEDVALPAVKAAAPVGPASDPHRGRIKRSLVAKVTSRRAAITTNLRNPLSDYVAIQEFGGTLHNVILPKRKQALFFNGRFASEVRAPRVIKKKAFIIGPIERKQDAIIEAIAQDVFKAFDGFEGA